MLYRQLLLCLLSLATGTLHAQTAPAPAPASPVSAPPIASAPIPVAVEVLDASETTYNEAPALSLTFSDRIDASRPFGQFIEVSNRRDGHIVAGDWVLSRAGTTAYFSAIEPSSSYLVKLRTGLPFASGGQLSSELQKSIGTRALYPSVGFASKGSVLPINLGQGLPVTSVNVPEVNVDFWRVKPERLADFFGTWPRRQTYDSDSLDQRLTPMMTLAYSGRFRLDTPHNTRQQSLLPVGDVAQLKNEPGVYMAVMQKAGTYYQYRLPITWFVISDIGLQARRYKDSLQIFSHSISTATPLAGVELQLLDEKGAVLAQLKTDQDGRANLPGLSTKARTLLATRKGQTAALNLAAPALDLSGFALPSAREQKPLHSFIYAPRDLYRPGENIPFSVLLRDGDGKFAGTPPLSARLFRPDGQQVRQFALNGNALAYYNLDLSLPRDAATGEWRLQVLAGEQALDDYRFKVEEFLPERMKLTLNDGGDTPKIQAPSDPLTVAVDGQYLYGAPAAGNNLVTKVLVNPQRHPLDDPRLKGFEFGDSEEKNTQQDFTPPDIKLDEQGHATLAVENQWSDAHSPLQVEVNASLQESGGRPVSRTARYTVWPGSGPLVGIRLLDDPKQINYDSAVHFEVVRVNRQGERLPAQELKVQLIRHRRDYYWTLGDDWRSNYSERQYPVAGQTLSIPAGGSGQLAFPVEWGPYRLVVTDPETGLSTSYRFEAGFGWYEQQGAELAERPDQVKLLLDKPAYKAGDTVHLKLQSPHDGEALLTVEGDGLLWQGRVPVNHQSASIDIPVKPEWQQHNLYINATVLRPGDSVHKVAPHRALGLAHLPLDRAPRQLAPRILLPADKLRPDTDLDAVVHVDGLAAGETAMVTLSAVDEGVLSITDFKTPSAHQWFFEPRRYNVDLRDIYGQIIDVFTGKAAQRRFGGSDDSAGGQLPPNMPRIVTLFMLPVQVDDQGDAHIPLHLPDFNGKLRLMVQAFSQDRFGSADRQLTVAAPVVAELGMPRFLAAGDHAQVSLDLHNLSGSPQHLKLSVRASAPLQLDMEQELSLADGERKSLAMTLGAAPALGQGQVTVDVSNQPEPGAEAITLHREWGLGVRPAYPAIIQSNSDILSDSGNFKVPALPDGLIDTSVQVSLVASNTPPIDVRGQIDELLHYPYGCLEQTTSSTYPWLYATPATLATLGIPELRMRAPSEPGLAMRNEMLARGISRLASFQLPNGGFGYWGSDSEENLWVSVYATDFLLDAREQGVPVDNTMLDKALNRLLQYLNLAELPLNDYWTWDSQHFDLAYQAYAGYVLSRVNRAPLGSLRTVYDQRKGQAKRPLPLMHLGLALLNQGDEQRGREAIQAAIKLIPEREHRYYFWGDYGTELRDQANMVYLAEQSKLPSPQRAELIQKLQEILPKEQYLSTQERIALLRAALSLSEGQRGQPWKAELILAGQHQALEQSAPLQRSLGADQVRAGAILLQQAPGQRLYVSSTLRAYPSEAPSKHSGDLSIERSYLNTQGEPISLSNVHSGDLVVVQLDVQSSRRVPDALVVDMLPAGFELENQNLAHSLKLKKTQAAHDSDEPVANGDGEAQSGEDNADSTGEGDEDEGEAGPSRAHVKYQEYRDDRYVAAVDLREYGSRRDITHLRYVMRAVTPGHYKVPNPYVESMYNPSVNALGAAQADVDILPRGNH